MCVCCGGSCRGWELKDGLMEGMGLVGGLNGGCNGSGWIGILVIYWRYGERIWLFRGMMEGCLKR